MASSRTATLFGMGAILLWASLATLTTLKGPIPPFQTTAMVFTVGATVAALIALLRGRLHCMRPTAASLALGIYGLFGYHALYFAALKLAPPAEAHLISSLWALLTALLSGLLPGAAGRRPGPGGRRLPAVGRRHEGRQRAAAGRALLRLAHPLHRAPRAAGLRQRCLVAGHCVRADGGGGDHRDAGVISLSPFF